MDSSRGALFVSEHCVEFHQRHGKLMLGNRLDDGTYPMCKEKFPYIVEESSQSRRKAPILNFDTIKDWFIPQSRVPLSIHQRKDGGILELSLCSFWKQIDAVTNPVSLWRYAGKICIENVDRELSERIAILFRSYAAYDALQNYRKDIMKHRSYDKETRTLTFEIPPIPFCDDKGLWTTQRFPFNHMFICVLNDMQMEQVNLQQRDPTVDFTQSSCVGFIRAMENPDGPYGVKIPEDFMGKSAPFEGDHLKETSRKVPGYTCHVRGALDDVHDRDTFRNCKIYLDDVRVFDHKRFVAAEDRDGRASERLDILSTCSMVASIPEKFRERSEKWEYWFCTDGYYASAIPSNRNWAGVDLHRPYISSWGERKNSSGLYVHMSEFSDITENDAPVNTGRLRYRFSLPLLEILHRAEIKSIKSGYMSDICDDYSRFEQVTHAVFGTVAHAMQVSFKEKDDFKTTHVCTACFKRYGHKSSAYDDVSCIREAFKDKRPYHIDDFFIEVRSSEKDVEMRVINALHDIFPENTDEIVLISREEDIQKRDNYKENERIYREVIGPSIDAKIRDLIPQEWLYDENYIDKHNKK